MNAWSYAALILMSLQALWCLVCLGRRHLPEQPGETKRYPWGRGFVIISVVLEVLMAAFVMGTLLTGAGGVSLMFALFQLLATALVTESCLHLVVLTEDGFVIRTHFGRVHTCAWEDVLHCTGDPRSAGGATSLRTKQGRFFLTFSPTGTLVLLGMIRAQRRRRGLGPLPVHRASLDPFGGHVRDWQGLVVAYALVTLVLLATMALLLVTLLRPINAENTVPVTVSFSAWNADGEDALHFVSEQDGRTYRVTYNLAGMEPVKAACGTGAQYEVYTRIADPDKTQDIYRIYALTGADGTTYLTFAQAAAEERAEGLKVLALFGGFLLLWGWIVLRSIQVGRHPERYSERTIRRYFKPGVVK